MKNRKEITEKFALQGLFHALLIISILAFLSVLVGCKKEILDTPVETVHVIDYSKPYDDIRNDNDVWIDFSSLGYHPDCGFDVSIMADFNLDGYMDVLAMPNCHDSVDARQPPLKVYLNDSSGGFYESSIIIGNNIGLQSGTRQAVVGDYNGDLVPDVIFASHGGHGGPGGLPSMLLSNGTSFVFSEFTNIPYMWWARAASGDIDNDGDLDVILGGNTQGYLINDGSANFTYLTEYIVNYPRSNVGVISLYDINKDGQVDLFIKDPNGANDELYYNDSGTFNYNDRVALPGPVLNGVFYDAEDRLFYDLDNDNVEEIITFFIPPSFTNGPESYIQVLKKIGNEYVDVTSTFITSPSITKTLVFLRISDIDKNGKVNLFEYENKTGSWNIEWNGTIFN